MVLKKRLKVTRIGLAFMVSVFSIGILPTSYAFAAKPSDPPARSAQSTAAPAPQSSKPERQTRPSSPASSQPRHVAQAQAETPPPSHSNSESFETTTPPPAESKKPPKKVASSTMTSTKKDVTPGNNGTIKVTETGDPNDSPPNNDPHVTCPFDIEFYRFDANAITDVNFSPDVGPQGAPDSASIKTGQKSFQLDNDGVTGGTAFDGEETYEMNLIGSPHPKQGYHLKVTTYTTQSLGSTKKSKVFWLTCPTATTVAPSQTPPTPPGRGGSILTQGIVLGVSNFVKAMSTPATIATTHTLGAKASTASPLGLPARIPATGVGDLGNPLHILLASLLAYGAVYLVQGRKKFDKTGP